MGARAGVCYGSDTKDDIKNFNRGLNCLLSGHGRVQEYVNVEMVLEGYSARVIREWYTAIGSLPTRLQSSTRYINYQDGFDYVIPHSIENDVEALKEYVTAMDAIKDSLQQLSSLGVPKEDSAMLLPLGMTTTVVDKRNLRNLIDMSHQRKCTKAYWEYRKLFRDIEKALIEYGYGEYNSIKDNEWFTIIDQFFVPKCEYLGYCPESKSCGRHSNERPQVG